MTSKEPIAAGVRAGRVDLGADDLRRRPAGRGGRRVRDPRGVVPIEVDSAGELVHGEQRRGGAQDGAG